MTHLSTLVEIAAELRSRAGLSSPHFSTASIIETCFPGTLVTGGRLPDGVDEIVSRDCNGPVIIYARRLSIPDQRIAIAHALAHLLFDDGEVCIRPGRAGVAENEERADRFAAELLAPLALLRTRVHHRPSVDAEDHEIYLDHVDNLASVFAVPASVIDEQIRRLA